MHTFYTFSLESSSEIKTEKDFYSDTYALHAFRTPEVLSHKYVSNKFFNFNLQKCQKHKKIFC